MPVLHLQHIICVTNISHRASTPPLAHYLCHQYISLSQYTTFGTVSVPPIFLMIHHFWHIRCIINISHLQHITCATNISHLVLLHHQFISCATYISPSQYLTLAHYLCHQCISLTPTTRFLLSHTFLWSCCNESSITHPNDLFLALLLLAITNWQRFYQ